MYNNKMKKERIALIGLGPHAKRIYYPYLDKLIKNDSSFSLDLIIDLDTNKHLVEDFLKKQTLRPKSVIYLDSVKQITPRKIDPIAYEAIKNNKITKAIIATEPKAHKIYLETFIKLGVPVVVDKPVTAPVGLMSSNPANPLTQYGRASQSIYKDVVALQKMIENNPKSRVLVQCQRRNHGGYKIVMDKVSEIVKEYGVPITYINIHHSDGMWNMPDEFVYRENHPYKYGYGKLMHSGYHFIDLLTSLLKMNLELADKKPDTIKLFSQNVRPFDQHVTVADSQYENFFGKEMVERSKPYMAKKLLKSYGEVDSHSQIQLTKQGRVITTAQLSLMQSGFSQRAWADLPNDTYKSNGRVRHEFINIHVGPIFSIQVHSYQAVEIADQSKHYSNPGDKNHFDIYIFRNSNLIGGEPFEVIKFGANDNHRHVDNLGYLGHNEEARYRTMDELMYGQPSNSELEQHIETNKMLAAIHKNHIKQHYGKIPISKFKIKEIL